MAGKSKPRTRIGVTKRKMIHQTSDIRFLMVWLTLVSVLKIMLSYLRCVRYLNPFYIISERQRQMYFSRIVDGQLLYMPPMWERILDLLQSDARGKRKTLKWVQSRVPLPKVSDFSSSWQDGIVLCALVETVVPGSCPRHDLLKSQHRINNCRLGIRLAQKHLNITQLIITPEEMAIADIDSEVKIRQLCSVIRWKSNTIPKGPCQEAKNNIRSSQSVDDISPTCTAKGRGLHFGSVGRGSKFSIQMGFETIYDLYIEIHGPNTEYCKEILTSIFRSKRMSIAQGQRAGGSLPSLSESGHYTKEIKGSNASDKGSVRKIPLDYKCVSEGVFNITFVPNSVGEYLITINFRGKHIKDSPFKSIVNKQINMAKGKGERAPVSFYRNQTTGDDLNGCIDGRDMSVSIQQNTTDAHGNREHKRPTMSKQYTVTRRRILRRILTKGGKDVNCSSMSSSVSIPSSDDSYNVITSVSDEIAQPMPSDTPAPTCDIDIDDDRGKIITNNKFAEQMANEVIDKAYESISRENKNNNKTPDDAIGGKTATDHTSMVCCHDVKDDTKYDSMNSKSNVNATLGSETATDMNMILSKDSNVQDNKSETIISAGNQTIKHGVVRQLSNPRAKKTPPESPTLKILHSQSQSKCCYYISQRAFTNSIEGLATPVSDTRPMVIPSSGHRRLVRMTKSLPVAQICHTGSLPEEKRLINEIFDDCEYESLHMPKWNSIDKCNISSNVNIYNDASKIIGIKKFYNGVTKDFSNKGSKTSERRASLQRQEGVFLKLSEESSYDTDGGDSGINSTNIKRKDDGSSFGTVVSSFTPEHVIPPIVQQAKVNKCTQVSTSDIKEVTGWRIGVGIVRRRKVSKELSTTSYTTRADLCTYTFGVCDKDTDQNALPTAVGNERHNNPEIPNIVCDVSDTGETQEANQLNNELYGSVIDGGKEGYDVHGWLEELQVDNNNALRPVRQSTVETTDSGIVDESNPPSPMRQRNDDGATINRHRALCRGGYQGDMSLNPSLSRPIVDESNDEDKENVPAMQNTEHCSKSDSLTRKSGANHANISRPQVSTDESFSYSDSCIRKLLQTEHRRKIPMRSRLSKRNLACRHGRRLETKYNDDELFSTDGESINNAATRKLYMNKTGGYYFGENTPFRKRHSARKSLGKTWSDDVVTATSVKRKCVSFLCKSLSDNPPYVERDYSSDTTGSDYETKSQEQAFLKHISTIKSVSMNDESYFGFGLSETDRDGLIDQLDAFSQLHVDVNDRVAIKVRRSSVPYNGSDNESVETTKRRKSDILVRMSTLSKTIDQSSCSSDEPNLPVIHNENVSLLIDACDARSSQCSSDSDGHHTLHSFENLLKHFEETDVAQDYLSDEQQGAVSSLIDTDNTNFEATVLGNGVNYGTVGLQNSFQMRVENGGNGSLAVGISGPRSNTVSETSVMYTGDNLYEVTYVVTQPGYYIISIKWVDISVEGSPFVCKVTY